MIFLILLLGLILRLILINQSLWLDEAAQVIESGRPLFQQLSIGGDFQPPLFHLLLHFWMKLGTSEIWMRLLTITISIVSLFFLYKIGKKLVNHNFGLLTSFLLAINPYAVYYSQELRPYPLTVLVALLSVWGLVINSSLFFILGLVFFLYTTYFAPFFIAGILLYGYFGRKDKFKWILRNVIISCLFFIPWIPSFIEQLKNGINQTNTLPGWAQAVSVPPFKAVPLVFAKFFLGRISIDNKFIYGIVVILLVTAFSYLVYKSYKSRFFSLFASLFFVPLSLSFLISFMIPIIEPKRLLFILPFFLGLIGLGFIANKGFVNKMILLLIIFVSFYGLFQYYTNPRFQREYWREATSFVENQGDGTQVAIFSFPEPFAPYLWYQKNKIQAYGVAKNMVISENDMNNIQKIIRGKKRIFVFQYLTQLTDPENRIQKFLEKEGFIKTDTFDFPGVGFIFQYDKEFLALAP